MWFVLLEYIDSDMGQLFPGCVLSLESVIDLMAEVKDSGAKVYAFPCKEDALEWQAFYYPNENQIVE